MLRPFWRPEFFSHTKAAAAGLSAGKKLSVTGIRNGHMVNLTETGT